MGIKLAALTAEPDKKEAKINTCFIDMIQTARPGGVCPECCIHCGAFDAESGGRQVQLTREELKRNLEREIPDVRDGTKGKIVATYLSPFVTTDVEVEPTNGDAFLDAAELVYELSGGASKMLCISHGIRSYVNASNQSNSGYVNQIFSLFDPTNRVPYSPVEWKRCIERVDRCPLRDEVKDCIYRAFVNKLRLLSIEATQQQGPEGGDGNSDDVVLDQLVELNLPDGLSGKILNCLASAMHTPPISANQLMLDHISIVDAFVKENVLSPVRDNLASNQSTARLKRIVELIQKGIVPGFILTVDFARAKGKISIETNLYSYIKTLELLKPILAADSPGFLAVSIQGLQGDDVPADHPYSAVRAHIFFQEALERSSLTEAEKKKIKYDTGRNYVKAGRVAEDPLLRAFVSEEDACEVIPFQKFVDDVVSKQRKLLRARLRADGGIEKQFVEAGHTYNTTIKGPWEQLIDASSICEFMHEGVTRALSGEIGTDSFLTKKERDRKATFSWELEIEKDSDIFLIKPFSVLHRGEDRRRALALIRKALGVKNISQYMVTTERGERKKIRFENLKMALLRVFRPGVNIGQLITDASPYKDTINRISSTGESVGVVLGEQSYYAGEIMVLARILDEQLGINYLIKDLDEIYSKKRTEIPIDDDDDDDGNNGGEPGGGASGRDNGGGEGGGGGGGGGAALHEKRTGVTSILRSRKFIAGGNESGDAEHMQLAANKPNSSASFDQVFL